MCPKHDETKKLFEFNVPISFWLNFSIIEIVFIIVYWTISIYILKPCMPLEIGNRRGVVILDTFCHFGPNFAKISKPCADNTNFISLWDCLLHTNFPLNTLNSDFFVKAKLYAVLDCFTISKKDLVIKTKDQIKKLNSSCVSIDAKDEINVYSSGSVAGSISIE